MRLQVCRFNVDWLGDLCLWQMDYGYDEGKPCIVFKLNRIFGWLPELYTNSSVRIYILQSACVLKFKSTRVLKFWMLQEAPKDLGDRFHPDFMAVACHGLYPADIENIGNITYWPPSGFNKVWRNSIDLHPNIFIFRNPYVTRVAMTQLYWFLP